MGQINDLVKEVHNNAKEKGWWEKGKEKTSLECHMLMVTEIAEATEEVRNNRPSCYIQEEDNKLFVDIDTVLEEYPFPDLQKPEGEPVELVDCMIRIMDYFGYKNWDLEKILRVKIGYNKNRSYRHGGKTI